MFRALSAHLQLLHAAYGTVTLVESNIL